MDMPPILQILDNFLASPEEVEQVFQKAQLYGTFAREDLLLWFQQIREGISLVCQRFGVVADHFKVAETLVVRGKPQREHVAALYISSPKIEGLLATDCIATAYHALAFTCQAIARGTLLTNPHLQGAQVQSRDFPLLVGVEEAHHSWYIKSGQGQIDPIPGRYQDDPVELAAGEVIRQIVRERPIPLWTSEGRPIAEEETDEGQ